MRRRGRLTIHCKGGNSFMATQLEEHNSSNVQTSNQNNSYLQERPPVPDNDAPAAARIATIFVLPLAALTSTVLLYVIFEEVYNGAHEEFIGDVAVLVGLILAVCIWLGFA